MFGFYGLLKCPDCLLMLSGVDEDVGLDSNASVVLVYLEPVVAQPVDSEGLS